ncbi:MAG TPA: NAD(P)/FAD-dependent oxidoreductase [Rhizobium sp.]
MTNNELVYDVIVIGAGLSGLAASYALRDLNILVLERAERPGGRIHSLQRPPYWLNFGAHMFGTAGTPVGELVRELGLTSRPINGALLGMVHRDKRLLRGRIETYPLRLSLPLKARLDFVRMGLKLRRGSNEVVRHLRPLPDETAVQTRDRIVSYNNAQTLSQFVGSLDPKVAAILTAITERTGGDPDEMAAGYALRSFANVWSNHSPGHNLVGGSALFPAALADQLVGRIRYGTEVLKVVRSAEGVTIDARYGTRVERLRARFCISAVPAFVASGIIESLPVETRTALDAVRYGAFLTAGILLKGSAPQPWDKHYAISTPGRAFSVVFNQATTLPRDDRREGGSLMLFRGAKGAAALMQSSDEKIEDAMRDDLNAVFPEAMGVIKEIIVQKWPAGAPYSWPGRGRLQAALTKPLGTVALAGDYLEFPNMEAALQSGLDAAAQARRNLAESN